MKAKLGITCLLKLDLRTNNQLPLCFFLLAVSYGSCSPQKEKPPKTIAEQGQTGQKLKY